LIACRHADIDIDYVDAIMPSRRAASQPPLGSPFIAID